MKEIQDLQKAISIVEQATEILKKSQMALPGLGTTNMSKPEIHAARREGILTKDEARKMHGEAHHVAYSRTNSSGTVSNIAQKGAAVYEHKGYSVSQRKDNFGDGMIHVLHHPDGKTEEFSGLQAAKDWAHHLANSGTISQIQAKGVRAPAFSMKDRKGNVTLHDYQTGEHLPDYEGMFHPDGHTDKVMHTWKDSDGVRNWSGKPKPPDPSGKINPMSQDYVHVGDPNKMTESQAGDHLRKVAQIHNRGMHRKAESWGLADYHEHQHVPAKDVKGTEAREYTHEQVYGNAPQKYDMGMGKRETSPTGTDFSDSFMEKQLDANHDPFILKHPNGNRYLVDSQGAGYARYIAKIKEEPKPE